MLGVDNAAYFSARSKISGLTIMGISRENGYSAFVEAFFVQGSQRLRVAKTNGTRFVFAEPQELPPGTQGNLVVIVDGKSHSRQVELIEGVAKGEIAVHYKVLAPF